MTTGDVTLGDPYASFYQRRQWIGVDGKHSDEHPYQYAITSHYLPNVDYNFGGSAWYSGSMLTFSPNLPRGWTDYTLPLVNKCTNKVWEQLTQSKFNAGVFSGEFRESYHMICGMVSGLAKGIKLLKRKQFNRAIDVMVASRKRPGQSLDQEAESVAANHYMVWHFGILPLLSDISGAYDWMRRSYQTVKRVKSSATYKEQSVYPYNYGVVWQWQLKAVAEIRGEVLMTQLTEYDCVGLTDPFSVAWEITRLSWLVDWLLPIGNFLQAVNAHNKTYGDTFCLTRAQHEKIDHPVQNGESFIKIRSFDFGAYRFIAVSGLSNSRVIMSGLPWTFPTIENPLGDKLSRWVTSMAFLRQVTRR